MFAVTDRLLLRPGWAEDASALAEALGDRRVVRNLSGPPWPYERRHAEQFLATATDQARPSFMIVLRETGALIGGIGLHGTVPALGYWLAAAHWGRGYASEAAHAVMAIADEGLRLPRTVASHAIDNPASANVLRKLGFVGDGRAIQHSAGRGGPMEVRQLARERPLDRAAATFAGRRGAGVPLAPDLR